MYKRYDKRNFNDPQYLEWRRAVLARDRYRCQICGTSTKRLDTHHKNSWNWAIGQRYDVDNGVVLCGGRGGCHSLFHRLYGKGNNTVGQYMQFYMQYRGREPIHSKKSQTVKSKKIKKKILELERLDLLNENKKDDETK
jgi:predicted restriction endonuclease